MDDHQVKIGVYNLYWTTFGGGEQQAFGVVDALTEHHDIELIGPDRLDLDEARERLGARLDGVTFRQVHNDEYAASLASMDYELFINHTYRSTARNLARHGLYFVMFPHELDQQSTVNQVVRKAGGRFAAPVRVLGGVYSKKGESLMVGPVALQIGPEVQSVELELRSAVPQAITVVSAHRGSIARDVIVDGSTRVTVPVDDRLAILGIDRMGEMLDLAGAIRIAGLWVDGHKIAASPQSITQRLVVSSNRSFLDTYDDISSNSDYTQEWTRRWWQRDSVVITPPVRLRSPGPKEQLIVSVGRFFGEQSGHSKRQLEMVQAFRTLIERGATGWRLVLIGGCSGADREYAMKVREAAEGLPVELRLSAPGAVLDAHLASASIYWHAAGYGADLQQNPERAEHFGIAPVEAMSAGAVPVVFDAAGPASVVRHGVDGLKYHTLDELVDLTLRLIADEPYRAQLAEAARVRAEEYDLAHFDTKVRALVDGVSREV
jgi:glycosyltransferase involved in cell wall biosynthesis